MGTIGAVFFWSALLGLGCWLVVEVLEAVAERRAERDALGAANGPAPAGESAYEERLRAYTARASARERSGGGP